ncbi:uncharacterized protein LOC110451959 [Mizuhopecten yessoensis]|uniref:uncharacterized protein LOC110451959 n=1 Tax=Mizuhopecten yessoensis TaxID=6573 RepID=UPI000B45876B|nr:uncharacterized protein LOC110451959 [Mizuhopecten yessoensis]
MTRFTRFQDDPVTYTVWNITEELGVNPLEEIDLLVKWLGPKSSKQALSLRSANAYNPVCGLHRIWDRLDARYGTPELVESALRKKITSFPKLTNKDNKRLYDLLDLLLEVASLKETPEYMPLLATYDTSLGVNQIVSKITYYLQNRWMSKAANFHSDPIESRKAKEDTVVKQIRTRKTIVDQPSSEQPSDKRCPLHPHSNTHCLDTCKEFAKRSIDEKRQILKDNRICFRCCASDKHLIKDCKTEVKCAECKSRKHVTALHIHKSEKSANRTTPKLEVVKQPDAVSVAKSDCSPTVPDGGEDTDVTCNCAQLCGAHGASKSCAKIVKVNVHLKDNSNRTMQLYALIDDQSNRSLASPELLDNFKDLTEAERIQYTLSSCAGTVKTTGRRVKGLAATSMDGETTYELPTLIECSEIPANPSEIPIPETAAMHPHLKDISDQIPPLDTTSGIHLLLGRDAVDIHHVLDQRIGPKGSPFAQKIGLGWVIIGEVCLNKVHTPNLALNVNKTYTVKGHDSIFEPCQYNLSLREDDVKDKLFERTKEDDKPGWSVEDRLFIEVMNREFFKDKQGFWSAPLPFRLPRKIMPNNRSMALQRAKALQKSLNDNPVKKQHFVTFMDKVISSSAAEVAPTSEGEVWYLPIFGVYNAQKPNQIRGVFDSSATFQGTSLNDQLLPGPNLTNNLIGLLLRFRENEFAAAADIEQMFYSFHVNEGHRNLLRFFWYRNNDPTQDLIEFRMKANVFGNSPSPAVAVYGLRKSVEGDGIDQDVKAFVNQNFYVDDGLVSSDSEESVISLLKRTQNTLKEKGNLRLHKFISNSPKVMSSFPAQDLGKEMKNLQLDKDNLPTHKSLGLLWDLNTDNFTFDTNTKTTACTRRGILSMLNSIYDPLGFAAPITIRGKVLMRDLTKGYGWDDSLPEDAVVKWNAFEMSIAMLRELLIPRMIVPVSLSRGHGTELHVFCDASEQAVCAVAYLRTLDQQANQHMGFVLGKAKVAPTHGHTIPRLELCAALLGTEIAKMVEKELSVDLKSTKFYTDSKVVLGYLNNKKKRFYQYVSNRVQRILDASTSEQWFYIASQNNPADCGTRGLMTAEEVKEKWLTGPRRTVGSRLFAIQRSTSYHHTKESSYCGFVGTTLP